VPLVCFSCMATNAQSAATIQCSSNDKHILFQLSGVVDNFGLGQPSFKVRLKQSGKSVSVGADDAVSSGTIIGEQLMIVLDVSEQFGLNTKVELRLINVGSNGEGGIDWVGGYKVFGPKLKAKRGVVQCRDSY